MTVKIFAALVGMVLIGGGGFYVYQNNAQEKQEVQNESNEAVPEESSSTFNMNGEAAFRQLLLSGKNLKCDVQYSPEEMDGTAVGIVYIAPDKFRADITMADSMGSTDMSVIQTNAKGYAWGQTPAGEMAVVFDVSEEALSTQSNENFNMDENVQYTCQQWDADMSLFTPPSDITFLDVQAQMQNSIDVNTSNMGAMQCGACEQIPDAAAKTQCLAAMNCN